MSDVERETATRGLGGEQISQELLMAATLTRLVSHEHNPAFEMPALLLGNHIVKRQSGLVGLFEPGLGDARG